MWKTGEKVFEKVFYLSIEMKRFLKSLDKFHNRFKKHDLFLRNVKTLASNSVDGTRTILALFGDLHRLE